MSKKRKRYRGRMPSMSPRFTERVTIDARKAEQGKLTVDVTENAWRHRERIERNIPAALATCDVLGVSPGEKREYRESTLESVIPDAPANVYEPGDIRTLNECHLPRAHKTAPDVILKAGEYTLTIRLRQTEGRPNMQPDELLRASSKAREELAELAYQFGFETRELGRKQSAVDLKWYGGSCDFAITGKLSREAYEAIRTARYTTGMSSPWKSLGSGTDERMPKPEDIRRRDMKRKHERQADLRKQFNVV